MLSNIKADFSTIPDDMKAAPQWVGWYYGLRNGEQTKIPLNPKNGQYAKSNDASTWADFEHALKFASERGLFTGENSRGMRGGIGFMFANGFCGVDLDHVITDGNLKQFACDIVNILDTYTEYSPSDTGLHIFFKITDALKTIGNRNKIKFDDTSDIEIYDHERFFTVTGRVFGEVRPLNERTDALKVVYSRFFPAQQQTSPAREKKSDAQQSHRVNTKNAMTDFEFRRLVKKISSSKQGDKFKSLFSGNTAQYDFDDSRADAALCEILAWWTGGNSDYIDFVFRKSLLMRPKWDELRGSRTYGEITIDNALASYRLHQEQRKSQSEARPRGNVFEKRDDFLRGRHLFFHGSIRGGEWFSFNPEKGIWISLTDADIQADVANHFHYCEKSNTIYDIVTQCRLISTKQIRPKFNALPLINFQNGVLELDTGIFRKAKPDDYLTWQVGFDYDASATCELFDKFILDVTQGEPSRIKFLDNIGGYIMFPDCRLEKCFFLIGEGGNGKSVYLSVLDSVFANVNTQEHTQSVTHIQPKDFKDATQIIMLENSIVNIAHDIKPDLRGTEDNFKKIVSGESVAGHWKFHDTHLFIPRAKIICACNSIPIFDDSSAGLSRRPLFCNFNATFKRPDTRLLQKLLAERSGIFNRFYRAYRELITREKDGVNDIITPTCDQEQTLQDFLPASNPVLDYWLARNDAIFKRASLNGGKIEKRYVFEDFCAWHGKRIYPASIFHRIFQSTLRNQSVIFSSERDNSTHCRESYYQFPSNYLANSDAE